MVDDELGSWSNSKSCGNRSVEGYGYGVVGPGAGILVEAAGTLVVLQPPPLPVFRVSRIA